MEGLGERGPGEEAGPLETDVKQELVCLTSPPATSFLETLSASTVGRPANCCLILYLGQPVTYFLLGCRESKQQREKNKRLARSLALWKAWRTSLGSVGTPTVCFVFFFFLAAPCPQTKTRLDVKCHFRKIWRRCTCASKKNTASCQAKYGVWFQTRSLFTDIYLRSKVNSGRVCPIYTDWNPQKV